MDPRADHVREEEAAVLVHEVSPGEATACLRFAFGERAIGRMLRTGALLSGSLFLASLLIQTLPPTTTRGITVDHLRKAAASLLLGAPALRLVASGALLGIRGEWRYAALAGGVVLLFALAMSAGVSA